MVYWYILYSVFKRRTVSAQIGELLGKVEKKLSDTCQSLVLEVLKVIWVTNIVNNIN